MSEAPRSDANPAAPTDSVRERLLRARMLILAGDIDHELAAGVVAQLFVLAADGDAPITMVVNSPGGHLESGVHIHDVVRFIRPRVRMIGSGWVASAAALAYVAAPREDRFCLPNTRFLLHQPSGGTSGPAADMAIEAKEILRVRQHVQGMFARQTGQTIEQIAADTRRNFWMDAETAREYGLVGRIVERADEVV